MNRVVDYGSKLKSYQTNNLYAPPSVQGSAAATDYTKTLLNAMSPAAPAAPNLSQYDYRNSDSYQQSQALGTKSVNDAIADASAARQQALIGYGYNDNLASLFGGDSNLTSAAKNNPFSYLGNLQHQYDTANTDSAQQYTDQRASLLDALNKQNLTFGSTSQNSTGDLLRNYTNTQTEGARNYQGALSTGASGIQSLLGQIDGGVLQARQAAAAQELAAQQQAAIDALLAALANGTGAPTPPPPADPPIDPTLDPARNYGGWATNGDASRLIYGGPRSGI